MVVEVSSTNYYDCTPPPPTHGKTSWCRSFCAKIFDFEPQFLDRHKPLQIYWDGGNTTYFFLSSVYKQKDHLEFILEIDVYKGVLKFIGRIDKRWQCYFDPVFTFLFIISCHHLSSVHSSYSSFLGFKFIPNCNYIFATFVFWTPEWRCNFDVLLLVWHRSNVP